MVRYNGFGGRRVTLSTSTPLRLLDTVLAVRINLGTHVLREQNSLLISSSTFSCSVDVVGLLFHQKLEKKYFWGQLIQFDVRIAFRSHASELGRMQR